MKNTAVTSSSNIGRALAAIHAAKGVSEESLRSGKPPPRKLTLGTQLVRDWHGTGHTVTVLDEGFE